MISTQKIVPNLWFDKNAEEAVKYYTSIFKNSKIGKVTHYGKEGYETHKMPAGTVMTIEFQIEGQEFLALNGGPVFKFNEAVSFIIRCDTQDEIDSYWEKLTKGGDESAQVCGWLKDKFGVSWQVTPKVMPDLLSDSDPEKAGRVMNALMKMKKLDIVKLKKAYEGKLVSA